MTGLRGKVALVTGASRGVGKGIALGLGEAGAIVYITGRTVEAPNADGLTGTIGETARMVDELRAHQVAVVSLYPGLVRTESVLRAGVFDLNNSESPQFAGRAVAALGTDPEVMQKSGRVLVAAALALEYGFTDIDGKQPRPLTLEEA